ncbi:hypothetical protein BGZ76_010156 [Entomortierella beljakovae]|nr:hypothetical protein BGZ76_010156 [Entomortierella beljakovae]
MRYSLLASNETEIPDNNYDQPLLLDVGQRTVIGSQNKALGTILILLGLYLVFFGYKLMRMTLILMGFITWTVIVMFIIAVLRWDLVSELFHPAHYYFWMWVLAGFTGALLSIRLWYLGIMMIGGFGGFALSMGIIAACNSSLSNLHRLILLVFLICLGAGLSLSFERSTVILGTSLAGALILMFGLDEFLQEGYREMFIIFGFAGRILKYHPNRKVYIMIGSTLALACLGSIWEFWRHKTPLWMDREVLFWIRGHPFGKKTYLFKGKKIGYKVGSGSSVIPYQKPETIVETQSGNHNTVELIEDNVDQVVVIENNHLTTTSEPVLSSIDSESAKLQHKPNDSGFENMSDLEKFIIDSGGSFTEGIESLFPIDTTATVTEMEAAAEVQTDKKAIESESEDNSSIS